MNRRLLPAILIVMAFILFAVIDGGGEGDGTANTELAQHLQADYDYYINDMLLDRFGPDDVHSYTLRAQRVTHYPAGDLSRLETPSLVWHDGEQGPWQLEAERGTMRPAAADDAYVLVLQENVHGSTALKDGRVLDLYTDSLQLEPASKSAHTDEPVRIENGNLQKRGTGMQIDLNTGRISLLADVRARYDPPATP